MKKKQMIILLIAIILLAIGSYISFQIALDHAVDLVKVPFSTRVIYPHQIVEEQDIEYREIPRAYVDENILISSDDIVGKYVSLDSKIGKGSYFIADYLIEKEEVEALPALLLKENQVAFPFALNLLKSSGNTITQNQKVDVYATYVDKKTKETTVDLLLQNVRVIGVKDRSGYSMDEQKASRVPSLAILAINREYMNLLSLANEICELSIYAPRVDYVESEESILFEESKILPLLDYNGI